MEATRRRDRHRGRSEGHDNSRISRADEGRGWAAPPAWASLLASATLRLLLELFFGVLRALVEQLQPLFSTLAFGADELEGIAPRRHADVVEDGVAAAVRE